MFGAPTWFGIDVIHYSDALLGLVSVVEPAAIDLHYAYYLFNLPTTRQQIRASASGVKIRHTSPSRIREVTVSLPPLQEQQRMAMTLSGYDALIEANLARIRVVDEMVRVLFREWFPFQASLPTDGSSIAEPTGWGLRRLGDIAEEVRRNVPKGKLAAPVMHVGLEHIPRRSLALDAWEELEVLGSNKLSFKTGEVLFGKIRPYFHKVSVAPFDGVCSADTIVLGPKNPDDYGLVVGVVSSDVFVQHATATSNGAKMPRANWAVLREYPVLVPGPDVRRRFSDFASNLVALQRNLVWQNRNLRQTRDFLLPRLLSGQIELPQAEEALAEVASPSV